MATTFLDLPDELILHVATLLDIHERRDIRCVSKQINHLISPIAFEEIRWLGPDRYGPERCSGLSEYLRCGKELVFSRCTKEIGIPIGADNYCPPDRQLLWFQLLNDLVPTLANLHSLEWSYWPEKRPVSHLVIDALNCFGSLPNLQNFKVNIFNRDPFPGFNLKAFSNLSSLSILWKHEANINREFVDDIADLLGRCPNLEFLTFSIPRPYHPLEAPLLAHIFAGLPSDTPLPLKQLDITGLHASADDFQTHIHHLLSLKVLRMMFNRHADAPLQNGQIFHLLSDNSIRLEELTIDTTHPIGVLDYLSSYSGLRRLEFQSRYPGADTPEGIRRFFFSVLPLHGDTLQLLYLGWTVETLWTTGIAPDCLAQLANCQQLTNLSCFVTMTVGPSERNNNLLLGWLEAGMRLPRLQYLMFGLTCRYQPPLQAGVFQHYTDTQFLMEEKFSESTAAAVDKLKAALRVPFETRVLSFTLGP